MRTEKDSEICLNDSCSVQNSSVNLPKDVFIKAVIPCQVQCIEIVADSLQSQASRYLDLI